MRQGDGVLLLEDLVGSEIRHIRRDLAGGKRLGHRLGIDQFAAGEVDDARAVLHLLDGFGADGVWCPGSAERGW